jgi:hypothetical protein
VIYYSCVDREQPVIKLRHTVLLFLTFNIGVTIFIVIHDFCIINYFLCSFIFTLQKKYVILSILNVNILKILVSENTVHFTPDNKFRVTLYSGRHGFKYRSGYIQN